MLCCARCSNTRYGCGSQERGWAPAVTHQMLSCRGANSWLSVPRLQAAAGNLRREASQHWEAHARFGQVWSSKPLMRSCRPPAGHLNLHPVQVHQAVAASERQLTAAELALPSWQPQTSTKGSTRRPARWGTSTHSGPAHTLRVAPWDAPTAARSTHCAPCSGAVTQQRWSQPPSPKSRQCSRRSRNSSGRLAPNTAEIPAELRHSAQPCQALDSVILKLQPDEPAHLLPEVALRLKPPAHSA